MSFSKYTNLFFNYIFYYNHYLKICRLLENKAFSTKEGIEEYQFIRLKNIITYAYLNVPYYNKLFNQIGFTPDDFKSISDIKKIPYLTKQIIRENQDELISENIQKKYLKRVQTGGTTGMPTEFILDKRYSTLTEMVYLNHIWGRFGYRKRDKCIVLREDNIEGIIAGKKYWKRNLLTNWLVMSAFHLNADTFQLYYDKIMSYKPRFILAFASNAYLLARFIKDNNLKPIPSIKAVICGSEKLYEWQRRYMTDVFKARVFSYYGHSEKCILATESSDSESFEFYPQYGFVELINKEGDYCSTENERGEIVATGFNNFASPFIRYKTDDVGTYTTKEGSDNPHWFNIKRISGRTQDFLFDYDNIPKTYMHIDRPFWDIRDKLYAYQYVQNEPGKILLNIHAKTRLNESEIKIVRDVFHKTYFKFELEIQYVDNIQKSRSGKFRYLIQNIKIPENNSFQIQEL
jgi:phenylacetate-CoA ligase